MSPFRATATSVGWSNVTSSPTPFPLTPALPSVSNTWPSLSNLNTCCPLPPPIPLSAIQMKPSRSTLILCGLTNTPAPKLFRYLPDGSNSRIGSSGEPRQFVACDPDTPHRSIAQMLPSRAIEMPAVEPHLRPFGNCPQLTPGL